MEVFKLAFETIIVGLLSFVWLALAVDLLFPTFFADAKSWISDKNNSAMGSFVGVALLTLAYCFGSAIMPVAGQLINDEHWPLPEYSIRCWVMIRERWLLGQLDGSTDLLANYMKTNDFAATHQFSQCKCSYIDIILDHDRNALPDEPKKIVSIPWRRSVRHDRKQVLENDEPRRQDLLTLFSLYESRVLADASDKNDSLRQLHERIVVLRGAVINGALLLILCFFGAVARIKTPTGVVPGVPRQNSDPAEAVPASAPPKSEPFRWKVVDRIWIRTVLGVAIAVLIIGFNLRNALQDLHNPDIFDIPVLELLFGLATVFGGWWVLRGVPDRTFLNRRTVFVSFFLTLLAYGGWIWSEVIYDQQIILAFSLAQKSQ